MHSLQDKETHCESCDPEEHITLQISLEHKKHLGAFEKV